MEDIKNLKPEEIVNKYYNILTINKKLEAITHSLFHDFRGPQQDIEFGLQVLEERLPCAIAKNYDIEECLYLIHAGQERQKIVLEGLSTWLQMSTIDTKELKCVKIDEMIENLKEINNYNTEVIVYKLPEIKVVEKTFSIAIHNLIRNGLKYNDKQEKKVQIYYLNHAIIVEDNGIGFPIEQYEKLSQPFSRTNTHLANIGSGLGLSIARAIIEAHNFTLYVEAEPNKFTKMIIGVDRYSDE